MSSHEKDLALSFHHCHFEFPTDGIGVLLENVDRDVSGLLDRGHARLRAPNASCQLPLRKTSLLAYCSQSCGETQLILDLGSPGGGPRRPDRKSTRLNSRHRC